MNEPLPPVFITDDSDFTPLVESMKKLVKHTPITETPKYSKNEEEAIKNALPHTKEILSSGHTRVLVFVRERIPVSIVLSTEGYEGKPMWHLSMSRPNLETMRPDRVDDSFANRITKAFFGDAAIEGPPEGAFKKVRHFRAEYQSDA